MPGFTKLFSSITDSTIWCEPNHVRIVWITLLAMADRDGNVSSSVPGLAARARVSLEECEAALERFRAPDKYSRTPDHEGRRLQDIHGGWNLLNYSYYRALSDRESMLERKRKWWDQNRSAKSKKLDATRSTRQNLPQAEAEAEAEAIIKTLSGKPDTASVLSKKNEKIKLNAEAAQILEFLNRKAGKRFQSVEANLKFIRARLKAGATERQCRQVIARKINDWRDREDMQKYLRPETLFNETKFAGYVGELVDKEENDNDELPGMR